MLDLEITQKCNSMLSKINYKRNSITAAECTYTGCFRLLNTQIKDFLKRVGHNALEIMSPFLLKKAFEMLDNVWVNVTNFF